MLPTGQELQIFELTSLTLQVQPRKEEEVMISRQFWRWVFRTSQLVTLVQNQINRIIIRFNVLCVVMK
mgnify:CR=1 FL=1